MAPIKWIINAHFGIQMRSRGTIIWSQADYFFSKLPEHTKMQTICIRGDTSCSVTSQPASHRYHSKSTVYTGITPTSSIYAPRRGMYIILYFRSSRRQKRQENHLSCKFRFLHPWRLGIPKVPYKSIAFLLAGPLTLWTYMYFCFCLAFCCCCCSKLP